MGVIALLLVEYDSKHWKKNLCREKGKWVIYVVVKKVIYRILKAVLKTYKIFAKILRGLGMTINPHDLYVQNQIVNEGQITLMFHIDNILLTHINSSVVTTYIKKLDEVYGLIDLLSVTRGKYYEYLGITLNFEFVPKACTII